jgi:acyl-CoA thioesterase I
MRTLAVLAVLLLSYQLLQAADAPLKVICFGDSIVEGKNPGSLKAGERWIEKLQTLSGGKLRCINEGKGGRPASAVADFEPALKRTPDAGMLIIALGTNDSRDYSANAADRVAANLLKMIDIARAANPKLQIVLCAPYNINIEGLKKDHDKGPAREKNLIAFGKAIEKLSQEKKTLFINFYGVVPKDSLTKDGVHPEAAGHAALAEAAWKVLSSK